MENTKYALRFKTLFQFKLYINVYGYDYKVICLKYIFIECMYIFMVICV